MRDKKALVRAPESTPFGLLRQMTGELDRIFDDPWNIKWPPLQLQEAGEWAPKIDVYEKANRLITRIDLPGVKKEDVAVEVADGQLTLTGERKVEAEKTSDYVYRSECQYGSFYRSVPLPQGVKADDITATFHNGVLEVSMPLPAKTNGKKIAIQEPDSAKTAA